MIVRDWRDLGNMSDGQTRTSRADRQQRSIIGTVK